VAPIVEARDLAVLPPGELAIAGSRFATTHRADRL
jgi:hypothetical protein